jgi:hypothetical protein
MILNITSYVFFASYLFLENGPLYLVGKCWRSFSGLMVGLGN